MMRKKLFLLLLIIILSSFSMIWGFLELNKLHEYVLFFSMMLLLLHMWYGAYVFLKYGKLSKLVIFLGFWIILLVVSIGFLIKDMLLLFILFFFLFSLGNVLYRLAAKQKNLKKVKEYAIKKANIEAPSIPLILIGIIILYYFPSENIKLLFAVMSVVANLLSPYIMFVKGIYDF